MKPYDFSLSLCQKQYLTISNSIKRLYSRKNVDLLSYGWQCDIDNNSSNDRVDLKTRQQYGAALAASIQLTLLKFQPPQLQHHPYP